MRFGVLGTGMVGQSLADRLVELGHEVCMGSRRAGNEKATAWAAAAGANASQGAFEDAAAFGAVVINATAGAGTLEALEQAGASRLAGKLLIDVANPIEHVDGGMRLSVCNDDSLGEQVQRAYPDAHVVKAFNTVNAQVMVNPGVVSGPHSFYLCGNDAGAKQQVVDLAQSFGWPADSFIDLGDISGARAAEMYLVLWLRLATTQGSWTITTRVVR